MIIWLHQDLKLGLISGFMRQGQLSFCRGGWGGIKVTEKNKKGQICRNQRVFPLCPLWHFRPWHALSVEYLRILQFTMVTNRKKKDKDPFSSFCIQSYMTRPFHNTVRIKLLFKDSCNLRNKTVCIHVYKPWNWNGSYNLTAF